MLRTILVYLHALSCRGHRVLVRDGKHNPRSKASSGLFGGHFQWGHVGWGGVAQVVMVVNK